MMLGVVGLDPAPLKTWKDADVIWVVLKTPQKYTQKPWLISGGLSFSLDILTYLGAM